jgi:hypothetical protein
MDDNRPVSDAADDDEPGSVPDAPAVRVADVPSAAGAVSCLDRLDGAPLDEHVEIFDEVQRRLHEGLAELDDDH